MKAINEISAQRWYSGESGCLRLGSEISYERKGKNATHFD